MSEHSSWNIKKVLDWLLATYQKKGIPTPRLEAELLLSFALKLSRLQLYTHYEKPLTALELGIIKDLVLRRLGGEPIAYLLGHKEFYSLSLKVNANVLIPRPETELLVDLALTYLNDFCKNNPTKTPTVLDIGTGSGAIAIAIKNFFPSVLVTATDIQLSALEVAKQNASSIDVEIDFLQGYLFSPLENRLFDVIVSNPPYISTGKISSLSLEVQHEPITALDGGPDGLFLLKEIIISARSHLNPNGVLLMEFGENQALLLEEFLHQHGYQEIKIINDFSGLPRVAMAYR